MRIRAVTAHAFGPLHDQTLELAQGMTVLVGDNESAKSSWHSAIYAAVCGRRRGRGRSTLADQHFADLHKPWDGDTWLVSAQLELDDGRRIEMRHDLAGRVDCHAKDLTLGVDISDEVISDGAPDGSRWLGLDRDSFAATACVEQAHLLRVLDDAAGLQEHLQRAAATAGTDATAAAALARLDDFSRDHVGLERANSTKPLQRALNALARADEQLRLRREAHEQYLTRVKSAEDLRADAARKAAELRAHEAAAAAADAAQRSTDAERAAHLHAVYGDTPPHTRAEDDAVAQQASAALAAWHGRSELARSPERSSAQIRAEIDMLPAAPVGDILPHQSVLAALEDFTRAEARLEQHGRSRPPASVPVAQVDATDAELLDLARTLEPAAQPPRPASGRDTVASGAAGRGMLASGVALAAVGAVLVAVNAILGVVVAAAGVVVAAIAFVRRRSERGAGDAGAAEKTLRRERAAARCAALGIAPDPAALRAVTVARARAAALIGQSAQWEQQGAQLYDAASAATAALAAALTARGLPVVAVDRATVLAAADLYQQHCRQRGEQAAAAARHADLVAQLSTVEAAEQRTARDIQQNAGAAQAVLEAAQACGVYSDSPDEAAAALRDWLARRADQMEASSTAERGWAELQALLSGRSVADLQDASAAAQERARQLATTVDPGTLGSIDTATAADQLPALREASSAADATASLAEGALAQFASSIGSVAEAEEAAEQAVSELARVRQLADTLRLTRSFLAAAQDRVHRDIAPILAATVKRDLPGLTDGRYVDVIINPTTLNVQVCGPSRRWRDAGRLSYGTAEQVYLLLRIALADHLTRGHDTCPLLLDDATVHADEARTRKILDLLLDVANDRQVVVFTQEQQVEAWAHERLIGPQHAVRKLAIVPAT